MFMFQLIFSTRNLISERETHLPSSTHSSDVRQSNSVLSKTSRGKKLGNIGVRGPFPEKFSNALQYGLLRALSPEC